MFIASLIALGVVLAIAVVALNASHIPILRDLTGADPLETEEPSLATDLLLGHAETVDQQADRTGGQPTIQWPRKEAS
jgi:hypothetical protein